MEAVVLNERFEVVGIVDEFKSFIWTERYKECSDFEIDTKADEMKLEMYKEDYYILMEESPKMMIISTVDYNSSFVEGANILVSGKSLEYILHDRHIWETTVLEGNVQNGIKKLIDDAIISPTNEKRKITNFKFKASSDKAITDLTFEDERQYWGENLYDVVAEICSEFHIGFRVLFDEDNLGFIFELFAGRDLTFDQKGNEAVMFSPEFGNLISSKYHSTKSQIKNAALIIGEKRTETFEHNGVSTSRDVQLSTVIEGDESGLKRKEIFVDSTDLSMYVKDIKVPEDKYINRLKQKGETAIDETKTETTIEAEVDWEGQFQYGRDFTIGDIVEIENELQMNLKVRIQEVIRCHDTSGYYVTPSFTSLEEEKSQKSSNL